MKSQRKGHGTASASLAAVFRSPNDKPFNNRKILTSATTEHKLSGIKRPYPNELTDFYGSPLFEEQRPSSSAKANISKRFNDPVYDVVKFKDPILKIVDTFEFQRLRSLKQLGTCDFVFPSARHTRFEHSLGVSHLAHKFINKLQKRYPIITENDVLCVQIAGLCHDLGHGPFSHVFDGGFIKRMYSGGGNKSKKWKHEDGSIAMLRYLLAKNNIDLLQYNLTEIDVLFIEEMIGGVNESERKGRSPSKHFLYDIVNNIRSGLDVDKMDYLLRDMLNANVGSASGLRGSVKRLLDSARILPAEPIFSGTNTHGSGTQPSKEVERSKNVVSESSRKSYRYQIDNQGNDDFRVSLEDLTSLADVDDRDANTNTSYTDNTLYPLMICFQEKLYVDILDIFKTRCNMHNKLYQHKTVKAIEYMITDALELADPYILFEGSKTKEYPEGLYRMSQSIHDCCAYSKLNDSVLDLILNTRDPELRKAKNLIERVYCRRLYVCIGKTIYHKSQSEIEKMSQSDILNEIFKIIQEQEKEKEELHSTDTNSGSCDVLGRSVDPTHLSMTDDVYDQDKDNNNDNNNNLEGSGSTNSSNNNYCNEGAAPASDHVQSGTGLDHLGFGLGQYEMLEEYEYSNLSQESVCSQAYFNYSISNATSLNMDVECTRTGTGVGTITTPTRNSSTYVHNYGRNTGSGNGKVRPKARIPFEKEDLVVEKMRVHHGMGDKNPVDCVRFYPKHCDEQTAIGRKVDEGRYHTQIPTSFEDLAIRVFCKFEEKADVARKGFDIWCQRNNLHGPR